MVANGTLDGSHRTFILECRRQYHVHCIPLELLHAAIIAAVVAHHTIGHCPRRCRPKQMTAITGGLCQKASLQIIIHKRLSNWIKAGGQCISLENLDTVYQTELHTVAAAVGQADGIVVAGGLADISQREVRIL